MSEQRYLQGIKGFDKSDILEVISMCLYFVDIVVSGNVSVISINQLRVMFLVRQRDCHSFHLISISCVPQYFSF